MRGADLGPVVALVGGRVQSAPDAPAIVDGVVLIQRGVITAVGARRDIPIPAGARVLDCAGATVTAGFWNGHVHFTQSIWNDAESAPASDIRALARVRYTLRGGAIIFERQR